MNCAIFGKSDKFGCGFVRKNDKIASCFVRKNDKYFVNLLKYSSFAVDIKD